MQNPLRICICDDEETALQIISGCVEKIFLKRGRGANLNRTPKMSI